MKRFLRTASVIALVLMTPHAAPAQTARARPMQASLQKEFQALIDRYYATWNTGNPDKAAPLYAKDPGLVFYDIAPLKYTGWAEYNEGVRKVLDSFASAKFTPNPDLRVTRRGTIAWTTVTFHLSGKKKTGESVELDGRQTLIWENRGGKWLILHEHFSAPLT